MKLNIEELLIQVPDDLKETETFESFARLIVERCAVEVYNATSNMHEERDMILKEEAVAAIRKLLEAE